ncbi:HORMA domain-containing protein [Fimicolochytrium jonesii]|uniref:HORMA domain-containing protein n=1 Tax=Fimicolochytrium jonesii TaxID=1396493 RepID=UPI0022FEE4B7|nr:HORMA domain-containing protein [Fimicolochytrium jonesii]KAI8818668.1 HORMA domain-containing protein [Fimicolochytrium jonesii]
MTVQLQRAETGTELMPSQQQSLNLVRNLLGTTIGAITYLRGLFPENNFKDTSMGGLGLKSLERGVSQEANNLMDWLNRGCFHALERQYLRTMIFGIYLSPDEPNKLVEAYTFSFTYPETDGCCVTMNANGVETFRLQTKTAIMRATSTMLRRLLILTQTLRALPPSAYITMKLFYYDERTPAEYEPPCFRAGNDEEKFFFSQKPEKINIGKVETPHHALNLQVQTTADGIEAARDPEAQDEFETSSQQEGDLSADSSTPTDMKAKQHCQSSEVSLMLEDTGISQMAGVTEQMGQVALEESKLLIRVGSRRYVSPLSIDAYLMEVDVRETCSQQYASRQAGLSPPAMNFSSVIDDTQDLVNRLKDSSCANDHVPDDDVAPSETFGHTQHSRTQGSDVPESIDLAMDEMSDAHDSPEPEAKTGEDQSTSAEIGGAKDDSQGSLQADSPMSQMLGDQQCQGAPLEPTRTTTAQPRYGGVPTTGADGEPIDCPCGINRVSSHILAHFGTHCIRG